MSRHLQQPDVQPGVAAVAPVDADQTYSLRGECFEEELYIGDWHPMSFEAM